MLFLQRVDMPMPNLVLKPEPINVSERLTKLDLLAERLNKKLKTIDDLLNGKEPELLSHLTAMMLDSKFTVDGWGEGTLSFRAVFEMIDGAAWANFHVLAQMAHKQQVELEALTIKLNAITEKLDKMLFFES